MTAPYYLIFAVYLDDSGKYTDIPIRIPKIKTQTQLLMISEKWDRLLKNNPRFVRVVKTQKNFKGCI